MRKQMRLVLVACVAIAAGCRMTAKAPVPDRVLVGGTVWTGESERPDATGIALSGDSILAVGEEEGIRAMAGPATEVIELRGRFVMPGFVDTHTHFLEGGLRLASVDLRDAATPRELARRIAAHAGGLPEGTWILGGDWDHELWGGTLPDRAWIDEVTPDHPVFVTRLDWHMALANSRAMNAAGFDPATPDPPGGEIVRDAAGRPTGVFKDEAMSLIYAAVPAPTDAERDSALAAAMRHAASVGVTGVHDMGDWEGLEAYRRARARGALTLRVRAFVPLAGWERLAAHVRAAGTGDDWLSWGGLKGFVDGSLGSSTALFFDPYEDDPSQRGLRVTELEVLAAQVRSADAAGLQVAIHAIGDRANAELLELYAAVERENGPRDRRFRVEHAQHLRREDLPRFAELGVIPAMQPYHAIDDGRWAERKIGPERAQGTYAFRSLWEAGARPAFGSDWTVAPLDPLLGVYAAVTRRTLDAANPDGWVPAERIPVAQALAGYTRDAARAGFQEERIGTLRPGKLADLVVLDRSPYEVAPEELGELAVDLTIVGGRTVFARAEEASAPPR
ncbi:MAG: amidohydrolase [Gemmatimonadota bacterium]